jgi:hypothetical protein
MAHFIPSAGVRPKGSYSSTKRPYGPDQIDVEYLRISDQPPLSGPGGMLGLRLAVAPAWPAEPVGVAQPATR